MARVHVPGGAVRRQPETLSLAGTKQVTDAYDAYFAGGLGDLVKANGGDFFVDSHAGDPWGAAEELWASDMRDRVPGPRRLRHRAQPRRAASTAR